MGILSWEKRMATNTHNPHKSRNSFVWIVFLCAYVLSGVCAAQTRDQTHQEALDALYSLDFTSAEIKLRSLTQNNPENPTYWNQLATSMWLRIVAGQEKLNLESFSGAALGTPESTDRVSPEQEKLLRDTLAVAISKADAVLSREPNNVEALYAKGVSKGTLASFEAVVKKSYVAALRNAREARELHSKVLKLNPQFKDAMLTLGLYDYTMGSIPNWLRFFLGVFGVRGGDKQNGLMMVAEVARNGTRSSTDAKMLLVVIYNREKQYENSLSILSDLYARYPRNYLLELSRASVYSRLRDWDQAINTYSTVLRKIETGDAAYKQLQAPKVLLLLAKANLDKSSVDEAMKIYDHVVSDQRSSDDDRANARLWLGRLYDIMKERPKALAEYDAIASLRCNARLKEEALKYKKNAFGS